MSPKHLWVPLWEVWGWGSSCALFHGNATSQQALCKLLSKRNLGSVNIYYLWVGQHHATTKPSRAGNGGDPVWPPPPNIPSITPCGEV